MKQFPKIFFMAVTITGIALVALLLQLSRANASWGATNGRVANEPVPTLVEVASVPTYLPTFLPPSTLPAATPVVSPAAVSADIEEPATATIPASPTFTSNAMPAGDGRVHVVREGETLVQIADRFRTTASALMALNKLASANLDAGQVLLLPSATPTPATVESSADSNTNLVNGLSVDQFIIMPPDVQANVRTIFERGHALGRDPHAFSIIGDSTVEMLNFLTGFETIPYNLGRYEYLQRVLDAYPGSFSWPRMAVEQGIHSRQVFLSDFADPQYCREEESMIDCEWRLQNPSVVIIRIGSNDGKPDLFETEVRRMVSYALERGTVPIIGTKADQYLDPGYVNNRILRQIAEEYHLPLWDFQLVANTLPNNGLLSDRVHLTLFYDFDWRMAEAYRTGHGLQNLTALMALDAVLQEYESLKQAQ